MKVLYVVTGAEFGGPSRHVLALAEHVIGCGYEVGIVAAGEPRLMKGAQERGARFFLNPYFLRQVRLHRDLAALGPVFRAVRVFKPDLVSAHSTKAGFAARLCSAVSRVRPLVFTAHGWAFTEGRSVLKRYLLALMEQLAAGLTSKIVCVSEHDYCLALQFKVARPEKLVVIRNGIDTRRFSSAKGSAIRNEFVLASVPTITMVGRLVPQKDPITLLRACLLLRGRFKLVLVGEGALRARVERFLDGEPALARCVVVAGEREDVPEILAASDMFVLPSRWEGLPRAVIEAMAAGLPVVATNVGGVAEVVEDGVTGVLVPPQEPEALASALERLLDDEGLRRKMGEAGRRRAMECFDLSTMLRTTRALYEDLVCEAPGWKRDV